MDIFLFNLCNYGNSVSTVLKLYQSGLTRSSINELSTTKLVDETNLTINQIEKIKKDLNKITSPLSIYALCSLGLSSNILDSFSKKIKYYFELFILSDDYLIDKGISPSIINKIREHQHLDYQIDFSDNDIINYLTKLEENKLYIEELEKDILRKLDDYYITELELFNKLLDCYKYQNLFNKALNNLTNKGYIEVSLFGIKKLPQTLEEFLFSLKKDKNNLIFIDFINGIDLDTIQDKYEISRLNAKQIITKFELPHLVEEKYLDLYNTYNISKDEFVKIFQVDEKVFRYIELINKLPQGKKNILEMLEDNRVSKETRIRIQNTLGKYALIDGKSVLKNDVDILNIFAKKINASKSLDEIEKEFKDYWFKLFSKDVKLSNSFINLVNESMYFVSSNNTYRYYNFSIMDVSTFYSKLNLDLYKEAELSTKVIFNSNLDLMSSYDILDEYELYSILKKTNTKKTLEFNKKPIISLNGGNKNNQIKSLLFRTSPITLSDFSLKYTNIYGDNAKTFSNYVTKTFLPFYQENEFVIPLPKVDDVIINYYKNILNKNYYFIDEISSLANENNLLFQDYYLNKDILKHIGYKLDDLCIYKSKFSDFNECIDTLFRSDILDLNNNRLTIIPTFINKLNDKLETYDYIEVEEGIYYSKNKLNEMGISISLINDFLSLIPNFIFDDEIFNIDSLISKGLNHKIFDYNLPKLFYASLIRYSNKYRHLIIYNEKNYLFKLSNNKFSFSDLIYQIIEPKYYMSLADITNDLNKLYGINISDHKVSKIIEATNIYYSSSDNLYYLDYELFNKLK